MEFPESPQPGMGPYDQLRPYCLGSRLHWSVGTVKGRPREAWLRELSTKDIGGVIAELRSRGFVAVVVHRNGFADKGRAVEAALLDAGCRRVTASYDLNREQLLGLVAAADPGGLEVVVHQRMPLFHMEHCVFCAVLSPGTDKTNCGRPCDEHVVQLRDRIGVAHPLTADVGCRNTLWNAVPQSAAEAVPALLARGVRHFRVEILDESPAELGRVVRAYRDLLAGRTTGRDVWRELNAANRVGVTRGTLEERRNPLAII
jgi:collagenase-like PrtC family protease